MTHRRPNSSTSVTRCIYTLTGLVMAVSLATGCSSAADSGQDSYDSDYGGSDSGYGTGEGSGDWGSTGGPTGTGGGPTGDPGEPDDMPPEEDTTTTGGEDLCDDQMDVVLYLSPDDSNSMSSPVQARAALLEGVGSLGWVPIRVWEFLNYYTFDYPAAQPGQLAVTTEMLRQEEEGQLGFTLQIGVTSQSLSNAERPPMNLTLVLDESGSMSGSPMEMQQEVCRAIAASLKEGDIVSAVGWDTENAIKLAGYAVAGANDTKLLDICNSLTPGGGTDLNGGLKAGYDLADLSYDPNRINRVVLISDGGANAGVTEADIIGAHAGNNDEDGIYLVGVGVGAETYNDDLMDTVTDIGKGASVYIPSEAEAWKIFNTQFVNTMAVAARDVQVELSLPPGFEITRFSGEEYSSDPTEIEPQHLAPNDTMVFHQQIETCAPDLVTNDTEIGVVVRYKDAVTFEAKKIEQTLTFADVEAAASPAFLKGRAVFLYAEALKALRDNAENATEAKDEAFAALTAAEAAAPGDAELSEIRDALESL